MVIIVMMAMMTTPATAMISMLAQKTREGRGARRRKWRIDRRRKRRRAALPERDVGRCVFKPPPPSKNGLVGFNSKGDWGIGCVACGAAGLTGQLAKGELTCLRTNIMVKHAGLKSHLRATQ
eukprot:4802242-Pyramimonas_sp.AAC.1